MGKGDTTRRLILDHATTLATRVGLDGLSIGGLAADLGLSKSGLFAHFQSKEALQLAVVETASEQFTDAVVRPGLRAPRGAPRLRALMDAWLSWSGRTHQADGCFFVAVAPELDDRPGPVRDRFVQRQRDWLDLLASSVRAAVQEGHLRPDTDPELLAFELHGVVLSAHHRARLLGEADAVRLARAAVARLLESAAAPAPPAPGTPAAGRGAPVGPS